MAHSYLSFGANSDHMHDAEIIATLAWLRHVAEGDPDRFPEGDHPYLSVWREMAEVYMPGCLDPEFEETLTSPEAVQRFVALARAARTALEAEPEVISGDRLNAMTGMRELMDFQDRPKAKMLADLDTLVGVVSPD